jgi:hypothetical protein
MLGGLQYPDHLEPHSAVAARFCTLSDAIQKVLALDLQRLYPLYGIGHGIAVSVRETKLFFSVGVWGNIYSFVVDQDFVFGVKVVVDEHLGAPHHRITAYLAGIQPTDSNVSHHTIGEKETEESHIVEALFTLHVYFPACAR